MKSRFILLLVLVMIVAGMSGCDFISGLFRDDTDLVPEWQVLSLEVGDTESIGVTAFKRDGSPDTWSMVCSGSCVSASASADEIMVTGRSLGEATITVTSERGLTQDITVRVFDPMALMTDGLLIRYVDEYTWIWDDSGSEADDNGSYWKPVAPQGYHSLGSVGLRGGSNPNTVAAAIVVKELGESDALAPPVDYEVIWEDAGSGADDDGSFWLPVAPDGYVACGVVAQLGHNKPGLDEVMCVRADLTANAAVGGYIWDDSGSDAYADFGSWEIDCPDAQNEPGKAYLKAGTFVGVASHSPPASHDALHILNVHLPLVMDAPEVTYAPSLDSADETDAFTDTYLAKVVAVPFPLIYDASYSLHQKVSERPIYRVQRQEFYQKAYFYNNMQGSVPITHTVTTTTGISQTESETYSHSVGISITAEGGCKLIGGTVSVSVSYQFGYESTSSLTVFQQEEVSQEVVIPEGRAACLWHKTTRFSQLRYYNNTWETVSGSTKDIKLNSFVKGEYPH